MRATKPVQLTGGLGLCLLSLPLVGLLLTKVAPVPGPPEMPSGPPLARSGPIEELLKEAARHRTRAKLAVSEELSALEVWDPEGMKDSNPEAWRLRQLSIDPDGNLKRAQTAAQRAAALARTSTDAYRAAELLVLIKHELGRHEAELGHAQSLVRLRPHDPSALSVLRRAERCNGLDASGP
jgi:hypothetical protein